MLIFSGLTPISDLLENKSYIVAEWLGIGIAIIIAGVNFYVMFKMTWDKLMQKYRKQKQKKNSQAVAIIVKEKEKIK